MDEKEVTARLLTLFPKFESDNIDLPYVVAGEFAHYLLKAAQSNDNYTLRQAAKFINDLFQSNSIEVKNLATIGYLEGIQNAWGNNDQPTDAFSKLLNPTAQKNWRELETFWDGTK